MMDDDDIVALLALAERLERMDTLSHEHLERLGKRRRAIVLEMLATGKTYGETSGMPDFLALPEAEMRSELRAIDNDLSEQVSIVDRSFVAYLERGEIPAPYYAWRIAIILRRAKRSDLEERFLAAWCKHFGDRGNGTRYRQLTDRYKKIRSSK